MIDSFSYESIRLQLETFSENIPELLSSHPATAQYALGLQNLLDRVDSPFTVAVTGQMRVGKSTLLNALIGEDLAITGVNETTATINWFKYGGKGLDGKFRVAWKNKPDELFSIDEIQTWIGDSQQAADTRYLEFFSSSELLKQANFIDTPGTRSVIESHEATINEFLAQRCEKESMRQGGKADAIIYVFPLVARESDKDRLGSYGEDSRIPGSSPFNSIGVLHKWDHLNSDDPFEEATGKATTVAKAMKGLVADVIPVSAPLFIAAERYDITFWEKVVTLTSLKDDLDFEELLVSDERDFKSEIIEGCTLTPEDRVAFRTNYPLPWVSICLILKQVRKHSISSPKKAQQFIREKSGIPLLQSELEQRFFSKSRLIKILGSLNKAWEPCFQASMVLRNEKTQWATDLAQIPGYLDYLSEKIEAHEKPAQGLHEFLIKAQHILHDRIKNNASVLSRIDKARLIASDLRDNIDDDLTCLEKLGQSKDIPLTPELVTKLQSIFGYYGCELDQRCSKISSSNLEKELIQILDEIEDAHLNRKWEHVREHTQLRVEQLLDTLEQKKRLINE